MSEGLAGALGVGQPEAGILDALPRGARVLPVDREERNLERRPFC